MRVIGGKYKGRRFSPPARLKARPTTDMAREALFNVLGNLISFEGISVLDLFCGSGAISYEFISRGAKEVISVDVDSVARSFVLKTVEEWGIDGLRMVKADVFKMLKNPQQQFDVVFADPPYADPRYEALPQIIIGNGWLKPGGLLVVEHGDNHNFSKATHFLLSKTYGSVNFSFFKPQ